MLASRVNTGAGPMTFADKLRELRQSAAMSQPDFAEMSGLSLSIIRSYEQGNRVPNWRSLVKIARALKVSLDVFSECDEVADEPEPEPEPKGKSKPRLKRPE
jgi:transcriptional regulator with XRE-family HTH domain